MKQFDSFKKNNKLTWKKSLKFQGKEWEFAEEDKIIKCGLGHYSWVSFQALALLSLRH